MLCLEMLSRLGEAHTQGPCCSMVSAYRYTGHYDSHDTYASVARGDVPALMLLGEMDSFFTLDYMKSEL